MKIKSMLKKVFNVILLILSLAFLSCSSTQFDVRKSGAKGDGVTFDTKPIQNSIDKAYENGGATVNVPAGTYLIGTIILKDNVELHLQPGATLLGSPDYRDYDEIIHKLDSRTNGLYAKHFMVFAEGAKNISITGTGVINGNGLNNFLEEDRPQNVRPFMIRLVNCDNVTIRDVKLLSQPTGHCICSGAVMLMSMAL